MSPVPFRMDIVFFGEPTSSLGMPLVRSLVEQANAELEIIDNGWTKFKIILNTSNTKEKNLAESHALFSFWVTTNSRFRVRYQMTNEGFGTGCKSMNKPKDD